MPCPYIGLNGNWRLAKKQNSVLKLFLDPPNRFGQMQNNKKSKGI